MSESESVDSLIEEYNREYNRDERNVIRFPNKRLAVLWVKEIAGQVSDGAWENHSWSGSLDDWKVYSFADVEVDPSIPHPVLKTNNNNNNIDKLDFSKVLYGSVVEDRMIKYVRNYAYMHYKNSDLKQDLELLDQLKIKE